MQTAVYRIDKQLSSWTVKESLGLKKKTTVSKVLAKSSNFGQQKETSGPTLMLQAGCIHLGLTTLCTGTSHPLFNTNAISTKEYPKHPA